MFFGDYTYIYYFTLLLQGICVWHSIKKGTQQKWLWIIIILPIVGAVAYIFSEIINKKDLQQVGSGVGNVINPGGRVKKLEELVRFADTFQNRIMLADEYLRTGQLQKAIELYEHSLAGNFAENEHVHMQLCLAYFAIGTFEKAVESGKKVSKTIQFARSRAHIAFARSLAKLGEAAAAEAEFKKMNGKYANFEARYYYGLMLQEATRTEEALKIWQQIVDEGSHLTPHEKRDNREWISRAKESLKIK